MDIYSEYFCRKCRRDFSRMEVIKYCPVCGEKAPISKREELIEDVCSLAALANPAENSLIVLNIIQYELGDLTKKIFYSTKYEEQKDGCLIEAKIALSDMLAQCNVLCKREGWNFEEVVLLGLNRAKERISRYLEFKE